VTGTSVEEERGPWAQEAADLVTAASGGLLFGIPLLFTMEVWWTGTHTTSGQALTMLALTFLLVFVLNRTEGFRSTRDVRLRDALTDSVEAMALGLVLVAIVLLLLREIAVDTPRPVALGKIVYEAFPFCLGIAVANHSLRGGREATAQDDEDGAGADEPDDRLSATLADLGATVVGTVFVALNIAPTDEVPMIAAALDPPRLLALMLASLLVSYGIVFAATFARREERHGQQGLFQRPATETIACYLVSLGCSALMLLVFQRLNGPWQLSLDRTVVLALPASVGGAAGRLAI
jgi:putative integral membrane protein (TIGR02587 family)